MQLNTSINNQSQLTNKQKQNLLALYQEYYDNVDETSFFNDLDEKDLIIIIKDQQDCIQGFSTVQLIWLPLEGKTHLFLYSGDTIIREHARSQYELSGAFIHLMFMLNEQYPTVQKHWFLISKGFRTYRFLPVYFKAFYPRYDLPTPLATKRILDAIASFKFGENYDAKSNLIRFQEQKDCLNAELSKIPQGRLNDPHIRFFLNRNPNFHLGDELACITSIQPDNYNKNVYRIKQASTIYLNSITI